MIVAAHQPDLLPYSGFFYKMAKADVFDIKWRDQFVERGYQRRVKMMDQWVSIPLAKFPGYQTAPIDRIVMQDGAPGFLADQIRARYLNGRKKPPQWGKYGPMICDEILSIKTDMLWEFNLRLIILVRDILGIETPISLGKPVPEGLRGSEGLVASLSAFPAPLTYLSGTGARVYMGDCKEFHDAGISVVWSAHEHVTGDSILTVLFDHEDPMSVVLREHDEEAGAA